MSYNYQYQKHPAKFRKSIFTVTFLLIQLIFFGALIYYMLKKHQLSIPGLGLN